MARALYQTNKDISEDMLLGYLFFYNLGTIKVSENDMKHIFRTVGLDSKYLRKISPVDAYRRATSKVKAKIEIMYNGEHRKAYMDTDEVRCNDDEIVRLVGRKVVDSKNKDMIYEKVGEMIYDRRTQDMTINTIKDNSEFNYNEALLSAKYRFNEWAQFHNRDTVRNIVVSMLKDMHPVNLLDTGLCKFIQKKAKDNLYKMQDFIRELNAFCVEGQNVFEVIPIVDTIEQRRLVFNSTQKEVKEEMQTLQSELKEVLSKKAALPSRTVTSYLTHYKDLKAKVTDYEELLGTYMTSIQEQIAEAINYVEENREIAN